MNHAVKTITQGRVMPNVDAAITITVGRINFSFGVRG